MEDSIARLEMRLPDAEFERRLDGIERSVRGMADRFERFDPTEKFDASMQAMSYRLDALEKDHNDLITELRSKMLRPVEPPSFEAAKASATPQPVQSAFEPPPYAEPPPAQVTTEPVGTSNYAGEATNAFSQPATPSGFTFDIPPDTSDAFVAFPEFEDVFADAPQSENFLAQARRSAREASEKAENERRGRFTAFRWGKDNSGEESQEKAKPRFLLPALVAMLVVVAAAAALVLSQHTKQPDVAGLPVSHPTTANGPTYSVPSPPHSDGTQFVVAPQAAAQQGGEKNFDTNRSAPNNPDIPQRTAMPLKPRVVRNATVNPVPDAGKAGATSASNVKVIQLANAGNPTALTILGLRALDGTDGETVDLPDAIKFLSEAAQKGEAVAQYRLGTLYERGQGIPADPTKAAYWYEMAANQGNRKAMHNLAVAYASGSAGKKNMAEAARWFAKAADWDSRTPSSISRFFMNEVMAYRRACWTHINGIRLRQHQEMLNQSNGWACCRPS